MERILERYEMHSYGERHVELTDVEPQGSWSLEHAKLKARIEVLQRNQKHYMGEELDDLSQRELQNLEQNLYAALKHVRSRKNQLMSESISQLQKKEKGLQDENNILTEKVREKEKEQAQHHAQQVQWESRAMSSSSFVTSQHLNSLNARYESGDGHDNDGGTAHHEGYTNAIMPPWMLRHMNGWNELN